MNTVATAISNLGTALPDVWGIAADFVWAIGFLLMVRGLYRLYGDRRSPGDQYKPVTGPVGSMVIGALMMQLDNVITTIQSIFFGNGNTKTVGNALSYVSSTSSGTSGLTCAGIGILSILGGIFIAVGLSKLRQTTEPGVPGHDLLWKGITHVVFGSLLINAPVSYSLLGSIFNLPALTCG